MQQQQLKHACGTNQGIKPPTLRANKAHRASSPQLIERKRLTGHQAPNLYE